MIPPLERPRGGQSSPARIRREENHPALLDYRPLRVLREDHHGNKSDGEKERSQGNSELGGRGARANRVVNLPKEAFPEFREIPVHVGGFVLEAVGWVVGTMVMVMMSGMRDSHFGDSRSLGIEEKKILGDF